MHRITSTAALVALTLGIAGTLNAQSYSFQKVYNFPSQDYPITTVNLTDAGEVVGDYTNYATFSSAYSIANGVLQPIKPAGDPGAVILAVSGDKALVSEGPGYKIYFYDLSTQSLGSVFSTGQNAFNPTGLNGNEDVVGTGTTSSAYIGRDAFHGSASTYSYSSFTYPKSTSTTFAAINDARSIVGTYTLTQSGNPQGFLLPYGGSVENITFPGSTATYPLSINNDGKVFGTYSTANSSSPFVFDGTHYTAVLPANTNYCSPGNIKDSGTIVMTCRDLTTDTFAVYIGTPSGN